MGLQPTGVRLPRPPQRSRRGRLAMSRLSAGSQMPQRIRVALAVAVMLCTVVPAFADPSESHGPVVLYSAHPDLAQNVLTLYGQFGQRSVTVWLGDVQLNVLSQANDQIVAALPSDVAPGSYEVIVVRGPDDADGENNGENGHSDLLSVTIVGG